MRCRTVLKAEIAASLGRRPVLRMDGKGHSCAAISSDLQTIRDLTANFVRLRRMVRAINAAKVRRRGVDLGAGRGVVLVDQDLRRKCFL